MSEVIVNAQELPRDELNIFFNVLFVEVLHNILKKEVFSFYEEHE